jgi:hypothetical protein
MGQRTANVVSTYHVCLTSVEVLVVSTVGSGAATWMVESKMKVGREREKARITVKMKALYTQAETKGDIAKVERPKLFRLWAVWTVGGVTSSDR